MKQQLALFFKGMSIGAANVIPGVSGGTLALITGIYDRLIGAVKSVDLTAAQLLLKGRVKDFWTHVDGTFLTLIFAGVAASIVSLARLFKVMLEKGDPYETWLYAFFFGLILVSIVSVGRSVSKWSLVTVALLLVGLVTALAVTFIQPGTENESFLYLMLCGAAAMCSMILPGLSGSFVLILLGNYKLIMLDAISEGNIGILVPVAIGAGLGLILFAQLLNWVFKHYRDQTIALMTGFILGSLAIIWPWKDKIFLKTNAGDLILKKGEPVLKGYTNWHTPDFTDVNTMIAVALMIGGGIALWAIERYASVEETPTTISEVEG
jgi:putative membrane protein